VKYAWIQEHRAEFPKHLPQLCRVLAVTRQGYYAWRKRAQAPPPAGSRAARKAQRVTQIRQAHQDSRQIYGSPRVYQELVQGQGLKISANTVAKYMREEGLSARRPQPFRPQTTDSAHAQPVAPNTLAREFTRAAPDTGYVADITYLPTATGWLFLAVVLDLFSRKVVGYATATDLKAGLVVAALLQALQRRRPAAGAWPGQGLLFHSDRGVQYACAAFRAVLEAHGIARSMSRTGNCYDNAVAESFFATLKRELGAAPFAVGCSLSASSCCWICGWLSQVICGAGSATRRTPSTGLR
jgi:putative transposase